MFQDEDKNGAAKPAAADREPFRRLIDLQKQMIELVQRHERTKQECIALREQLLEEMAKPRRWPWSLCLENRRRKGFNAPGGSGWWWARNRAVPLFVPAKQPISTKSARPNIGKF